MAVEFDFLVALIVEAAGRPRRNQSVAPRPQCEVRDGRLVGDPWQRRIVDPVPSDPLIEWPHPVLARVAGEWRSEGDDGSHAVGVIAGIFTAEEAAQAPADDDDLSCMAETFDALA